MSARFAYIICVIGMAFPISFIYITVGMDKEHEGIRVKRGKIGNSAESFFFR